MPSSSTSKISSKSYNWAFLIRKKDWIEFKDVYIYIYNLISLQVTPNVVIRTYLKISHSGPQGFLESEKIHGNVQMDDQYAIIHHYNCTSTK